MNPSLYESALGEQFAELHPELRAIFSSPGGWTGKGSFDDVGCTRRFLAPFLLPLQRARVLVAGYRHGVDFTIDNETVVGDGESTVRAVRTLAWNKSPRSIGSRTIVSHTTNNAAGLHDYLGSSASMRTAVSADVVDGALRLESQGLSVRVFSRWIPIPAPLAPATATVHRWDSARTLHHIDVEVALPLIGTAFVYRGYFTARSTDAFENACDMPG